MLPPFEMSVPAEARYRAHTPEVVARYAELAGCPPADAAAVSLEVDQAVGELTGGGDDATLSFGVHEGVLVIAVAAPGGSVTVRRTLPAGA